MSPKIYLHLTVLILYFISCKAEKCGKSDLEFQYTECDKTGHRWLVSVPIINKTCDASSDFNIPKPARNCGEPCSPGTYLDITTQDCKDCASGTYSQGDTIEINNWQQIPPGFHTLAVDLSGAECKREEWIAKGDFISASVSQCESFLTFTASLYKPGELKFAYQMQEEGTFFMVKVIHDECQSKTNDKNSISTIKFLDTTPESSWNTKVVSLKKGRNVITWTVSGMDSERSTVKINNLRITNSIFSSQCTNCSAGYFSSKKSTICSPCPLNKFSDRAGSDQCRDCSSDKYALPGSKACTLKMSCTVNDYSYKWTECDKQKQRKKIYLWIEPKLCSDSVEGAVKLPNNSSNIDCELCPKGTFLNESLHQCQFCPLGTMTANAGDQCTMCSPNTKPVSTIWYDKWSHSLPNLTFLCIKGLTSDCRSEDSWILNGDHLQSSLISDVHFLQLEFQTNDKIDDKNSVSKSLFKFEFSLHCSGYCLLHLFLKMDKFAAKRLNTWVNSTSRIESRHHIPPSTSGRFIWFFSHPKDPGYAVKSNDLVKIYSIQMSDLKNVGAIDCRNCDPKSMNNGCLDCDKGKYFSKESHKCESCPRGHILRNFPGLSINDCVACGTGLRSVDGTICLPSLTFTSASNNIYDLTQLAGYHLLRGSRLFNTHGQEYVHVFNVTLFSNNDRALSLCRNNITSKDGVVEVSSPICRVTIVADKSQNNTLYSIQSMSLAKTYQKIDQSNTSKEYWKKMNESLIKLGFDADKSGIDLHVYLTNDRKTDVCTKGRHTIVTLRCDKSMIGTQLLLPAKCPAETCDGCNFHFLLKSRNVCPYCRLEDFTVLTEECVGGHQKRHFQEPSYCILEPGSQSTEDIKCPLVTMRTAIIVLPTIFVLLFLIGLLIYCYKKNKRLEYKYMRLIGGNEDNEHILSGAESCAMQDGDDDDDDDDDVKIKTNSKSGKIFARFNKPNRNRKDENDMETVNLNDNPEFDI